MRAPLTFLAAANRAPLAKEFTPQGSQPYPRVSKLNSIHHETDQTAEGLRERLTLMQQHAAHGHCMLKGTLKRQLQNESRAGLTETERLTNTVVIDIDGFPIDEVIPAPCHSEHVRKHAEKIVELLPPELRDVSYIAHASSSFGRKPKSVSMHLEFQLAMPVSPFGLKMWLQDLNLSIPSFAERIQLSNSGFSLSWIIDPSVADNSKLIYVATPRFNGVPNPFQDDSERWVLVEKSQPAAHLQSLIGKAIPASVKARTDRKINELRNAMGLPRRKMATSRVQSGDETINVLTNPTEMHITVHRVEEQFAYFNINGGDSNAYWCRLDNPDIIRNFKDEPNFQFSKANPEAYEAFMESYAENIAKVNPAKWLCFHDRRSDTYYVGKYNQTDDCFERSSTGSLELYPTARSNLENSLKFHNAIMPDPIPDYEMIFNPISGSVMDKGRGVVNRFSLPPVLREPAELPEDFVGVGYDMENRSNNGISAYVNAIAPNTHKLISHILGYDQECYEHFINWMAYCIQYRQVTNTAWVFSGLPGTGKGQFFKKVIERIWSEEYTSIKTMDNLEDSFTGSFPTKLMIALDEMHMASGKKPEALLDKIKHMIGESRTSIRAMRREQEDMNVYYNFMLFSNHRDAVKIEAGDRRFNVAPYQEVPLAKAIPDLDAFFKVIDTETAAFASFLVHFDVSTRAARTCLDNEAKRSMKSAGMNSIELFTNAIRIGDLDYFVDSLLNAHANPDDFSEIQRMANARIPLAKWLEDASEGRESLVVQDDLRTVYLALFPQKTIANNAFTSLLDKHNIKTERQRLPDGRRAKALCVQWGLNEFGDDEGLAFIRRKLQNVTQSVH